MTDRTCTRHTSTSSLLIVVSVFNASPRVSAFRSRSLFCSGALGIELDVRFLPLIQVASDRSVGFPNQLSVSLVQARSSFPSGLRRHQCSHASSRHLRVSLSLFNCLRLSRSKAVFSHGRSDAAIFTSLK